jgi:primosomal protein N'
MMSKENDELYEYDKASGHLFCKYCGNNYLLKQHKPDCESLKEVDLKDIGTTE